MSVTLREVTNRSDLRRFIHFPNRLFRGNSCWIPPLLMDEWNTLDRKKNPAYEHCRSLLLLAEKGGRLVGRIAGIINDLYIAKWGTSTAASAGWISPTTPRSPPPCSAQWRPGRGRTAWKRCTAPWASRTWTGKAC